MSSEVQTTVSGIAMDPYFFTCPYTLGNDQRLRQIRELGSGASGEVHKMYNNVTEKFFARKVLRPSIPRSITAEDIKNEIRAVEKLCGKAHKNLVSILQHGELLNNPKYPYYIDMELCDMNLKDYILYSDEAVQRYQSGSECSELVLPSRSQGPYYIWVIMEQVSCGIAFIHDEGWIHRDVKPANILFSKESGSWKIADFGFTAECSSKFRDQSSKEGRGTDGYRAPELRNKFPRYSAMTDVWSLGCVLYELAVGKQAFADDWAIGEYVQSNELKPPFEDLKNWSDNSMTTLKMIIQNTLAVDDFMRPAAEHFSNMMCNMIKREADQGHGLQEVRVFRCTCGGNLTSEHLFPQVIVGDRINVATADASSFDAEADPSDDSPPHDEGMDDDPMEIGDGEVERSKRLKLSRRRIGLKRTVNVNGYGIEKVRHTKTVVCVTCGEKFTRKSDLTRHDESVHQDERIYSCPHCPLHRAFARKDALKRHISCVHSNAVTNIATIVEANDQTRYSFRRGV